jgi:glucokinase
MQKQYAIGIDLGGTNLRVALVSREGDIIKKIKVPTDEGILETVIQAIRELFSPQVTGIGIGVAGLIDRKSGRVLISPNLNIVEEINLIEEIRKKFAVPVCIENDANSAALGELWTGAARNLSHFVLFTLGTGIGGGIVYNKKLLHIPAEIGHMSIVPDGEKCHCGNYGCLESYAAARAILSKVVSVLGQGRESILHQYYEGNIYKITAEDVFKAALDGDNLARELLKSAGRYLGIGIANIINLLGPEAIILTGGLIGAWDIYVVEAIKEASRRAFKELFEAVEIIPAQLLDDAGVIGAAGLILNDWGSSVEK